MHRPELDGLRELSARVGRDPLLIQASTGNTSIKIGSELWIKASGTCLRDAAKKEIFIPVDLAAVRDAVEEGVEFRRQEGRFRASGPGGETLTPSIETSSHAVLPHRVVIHVHSVNTIAWVVRRDGRERLAERLEGLRWEWIAHVASGLPLARALQQTLPRQAEVFALENHGLIVCGDDCASADALLKEVEMRLAVVPRPAPAPRLNLLERLVSGSAWRLPGAPSVHVLGTDGVSRCVMAGGTLYPCHCIFLGPRAAVADLDGCLEDAVDAYEERFGVRPACVLVEGAGVVISHDITFMEEQTLIGLANVIQRIPAGAPMHYLAATEVLALSSHPYRQTVNSICS